jgi:Arylsulfotransferase (ASST)
MLPRVLCGFAILGLGVIACNDSTDPPDSAARIDSSEIVANPNMEISALVLFRGGGDSARVRYRVTGGADSLTPAVAFTSDQDDTVAVLGLLPETAYEMYLVVYGGEPSSVDSQVSQPHSFTTGALPVDLPTYIASGSVPLEGYVVFSASPFGIIIDRTGRVVWYKRFPGVGGPSLNFMAQPTGSLVGRLHTEDEADDDPFVEIDPAGFERRQLRCAENRPLRFHDLLLLADGSYWIMCDETRTMDLTSVGGQANAPVTGTTLQHVHSGGTLLYEWTPFDHFEITDADPSVYQVPEVNWTHGNSFDFDTDGNILMAFRSLNEVTKIDAQTGEVIWRMGGLRNQFTFEGSPDPGFSRQHNVRVVGPGRFILLDNVGLGIAQSRYERYAVNEETHTAVLEQSYASAPPVLTLIGGSVQATESDQYLVSFGTEGRVELFDAAGVKLWGIEGNPGYVFRAQRIRSLYSPVPVATR